MTLKEHVTALFAVALYCWFTGEESNAKAALEVAVRVADSGEARDA